MVSTSLWGHIFRLAQDELDRDIKLAPKITMNHVKLDPYSKMNVKFATQVLSQTVSNVLFNYYPEETFGTAGFISKINKFFDCLNVRSLTEHITTRNPDKAPYESQDDPRFDWLENDFLKYLHDWSESVNNREGDFTAKDRQRMFLAHQTYEGLQITAKSAIEMTRYLLSQNTPFVLTEHVDQDVAEEYFMRQRSLGRRNENPDLREFGYQDRTIQMQRSIVPHTGNTAGKYKKREHAWKIVDPTPLKKAKKTKKSKKVE